jgi:PAS domain S-box-containing protein
MRHYTDEMTLVGGLLMAALLTLAVHLGQTARLRARALEAANRELKDEIAERKRAEEALRESETQFRELYDQAPVGYHECGADGRISRVNRTLMSMLGYTAEEMLGRPAWEFILEQETSRQAIAAKFAGTEPLRAYERTWRRKDGTPLPALMQDHRLHDADGRVVGLRSTVHDITEHKRTETE